MFDNRVNIIDTKILNNILRDFGSDFKLPEWLDFGEEKELSLYLIG